MGIKETIKPTKLKILIAALLFLLPFIIQYFVTGGTDAVAYGFPLPILTKIAPQCVVGSPCPPPSYTPHIPYLIIDVIVLYFVTLFIIFTLGKLKKMNNFIKASLLTLILFGIFTLISFAFSIGYPLMKATNLGLPLVFFATFQWDYPSFFLEYLLVDIVYWFIISILIILIYNKLKIK